MKLFSERMNLVPTKLLQLESIDNTLKNDLWNSITKHYLDKVYCIYSGSKRLYNPADSLYESTNNPLILNIFENFLFVRINNLLYQKIPYVKNIIQKNYDDFIWYEIYDFIEFLFSIDPNIKFKDEVNFKLERNNSAYKFIDNIIMPITNQSEINSIETTLDKSKGKFRGVEEHIRTAMQCIADRQSPDYRNSIKESFSAIESLCIIISGDSNSSLGKALSKIDKNNPNLINKSLIGMYSSYYGYVSDQDGIRHAMLEEPNLTLEDAIFWLVSCSSFINYLIVKAEKANIFNKEGK